MNEPTAEDYKQIIAELVASVTELRFIVSDGCLDRNERNAALRRGAELLVKAVEVLGEREAT